MMETSLQLKKLNFVFWFFSFVCCATMRAIIAAVLKKDKDEFQFRRLHLPPEVTCTAVNELEPISNERRRPSLGCVGGPITDRRLVYD